jgi:curved DNA-binding protein CbpA
MRTHYEDLHVTEDAPDEVIRAAYRSLSLKHHPDTSGDRPQSKWKMQRINDAYAVLADTGKRADYDAHAPAAAESRGLSRNLLPHAATRVSPAAPASHAQRSIQHTPSWLRVGLGWLSDARLALPLVAILWLVVLWMMKKPWG